MNPPDREMTRILNLPVDPAPPYPPAAAPVELRPPQARCMAEWARALRSTTPFGPPGIAALLGCGHGKTLVSLLLAPVAEAVTGTRPRVLHLVPASLREQLATDAAGWGLPLDSDAILSHEALSAPSGRWRLRTLAPTLIVIDEAHRFAEPESGRWRRVAEYLRTTPDTRICLLSGSLSWRSLRQARHLLLACLRGWCPLPADRTLDHWAACIDVGGEPCADDRRVLAALRAFAHDTDDRAAYHRRLRTCPGVVLTSDVGVAASLHLTAWRPPVIRPDALVDAVKGLERSWELPDGTELISALEVARHGATLALGLYQRWDPTTVDEDCLERRRTWAGHIRAIVQYQGRRYQTPSAVVDAAERGHLAAGPMHAYHRWTAVADRPPPVTEEVWLEGAGAYMRDVLAAWGEGLIWVQTPAIGEAVAAILSCAYHGAGSAPPTGGTAVASMRVHGTGWDGAPRAGYRRALVLEPPASAATWEQVLSRLHRAGATDDVEVHILADTDYQRGALRAGIAGAEYIRATTGSDQRLLVGDWTGWYVDRRPTNNTSAPTGATRTTT